MSEFVVAKFGGTSMAHPELVAEIVEAHPEQQLIVVSAPGGDETTSVRTTGELRKLAEHAGDGNWRAAGMIASERIERFRSIYDRGFGTETGTLAEQIAQQNFVHLTHRSADHVVGMGEIISGLCIAKAIGAEFVWPGWIRFATDGTPLEHQPDYLARILRDKNRSRRIVIPGFVGSDDHGNVFTLGTGASDQTGGQASKIAGMVFGDENVVYENWTDVDGILSGNPKIVAAPQTIPELTRREVREGAHGGTGVLQGDTIVDLDGSEVVTIVKNTKNPLHPGTRVVTSRDPNRSTPIVAVTGRDDLIEVIIDDLGMARQVGYTEHVLEVLREFGLSYEHSPSSQDTISLTIHNGGDDEERTERGRRIDMFAEKVRVSRTSSSASVTVNERGVIYMIGEQLRDSQQLANATVRAIGAANLQRTKIRDIVSSGSSPSLALLTDRQAVNPLIRALHAQEIENSVDLFGQHRNDT